MMRVVRIIVLVGLLVMAGWMVACDSDAPGPPDGIPPNTIVDLYRLASTGDSTYVTWTAPGDDGKRGRATAYDIRIFNEPLTSWWDSATRLSDAPVPRAAGLPETLVIRRSTSILNYFVALKAVDDAGNWSAMSNQLRVGNLDGNDPSRIDDLAVTMVAPHAVTVTFTAPGDDGRIGRASRYLVETLILDPLPRRVVLVDPDALPLPGTPGTPEALRLPVFAPSSTYRVWIVGEDNAQNRGLPSDTLQFTTPLDDIPPGRITGLEAVRTTVRSAVVRWIVPGNDGGEGRVEQVELRVSEAPFTWDSAIPVAGLPVPGQPGTRDSVKIEGLEPQKTYVFAARARDAAGLSGDLSEELQVSTTDFVAPGRVTDLTSAGVEPHAVTLRFTAPGDDENVGTVSSYEVRAHATLVHEENWDSTRLLTVTSGTPVPPGESQTLRAYGLEAKQMYRVALRARDDVGNLGPVSNNVEIVMPSDYSPPGKISDLRVLQVEIENVTLTWTATGNDGLEGRSHHYEVRYADRPINNNNWFQTGLLAPVAIIPRIPGSPETLRVEHLPGGITTWFAVLALDVAGNRGEVSNATSVYVPRQPVIWVIQADGSGDAPTIQDALDRSRSDDVIRVGPGIYHENLDFVGRSIRLESIEGAAATILDGSTREAPVIRIDRGEESAQVLGFTIQGGVAANTDPPGGGGIRIVGAGQVTLRDNVIRNNHASIPDGRGGGLYCASGGGSNPILGVSITGNTFQTNEAAGFGGGAAFSGVDGRIEDNLFTGNQAHSAGGVYLGGVNGAATRFSGNRFVENVAVRSGGGMYVTTVNPLVIDRNLFLRNRAAGHFDSRTDGDTGGGLYLAPMLGSLRENTFVDNASEGTVRCRGGSVVLGQAGNVSGVLWVERNIVVENGDCMLLCRSAWATILVEDNLFWPEGRLYLHELANCVEDDWEAGNLISDPRFCAPETDDYRVAENSPALGGTLPIGAYPAPGCGPRVSLSTWTGIRRVSGR